MDMIHSQFPKSMVTMMNGEGHSGDPTRINVVRTITSD
jgi:hypothetical protein